MKLAITLSNRPPDTSSSPTDVNTDEDSEVEFQLTATDEDGSGQVRFYVVSLPTSGSILSWEPGPQLWFEVLLGQQHTCSCSWQLKYLPDADFHTYNLPPDTFTFYAQDLDGANSPPHCLAPRSSRQ